MFTSPSQDNSFDLYDEPRLHMERLLKAKLVEFDLSIRILLPLESAGIITLGDLTQRSAEELRRIPQLGEHSFRKLEKLLDRLDLSLSK